MRLRRARKACPTSEFSCECQGRITNIRHGYNTDMHEGRIPEMQQGHISNIQQGHNRHMQQGRIPGRISNLLKARGFA